MLKVWPCGHWLFRLLHVSSCFSLESGYVGFVLEVATANLQVALKAGIPFQAAPARGWVVCGSFQMFSAVT